MFRAVVLILDVLMETTIVDREIYKAEMHVEEHLRSSDLGSELEQNKNKSLSMDRERLKKEREIQVENMSKRKQDKWEITLEI